jgi:hypothetical protein
MNKWQIKVILYDISGYRYRRVTGMVAKIKLKIALSNGGSLKGDENFDFPLLFSSSLLFLGGGDFGLIGKAVQLIFNLYSRSRFQDGSPRV